MKKLRDILFVSGNLHPCPKEKFILKYLTVLPSHQNQHKTKFQPKLTEPIFIGAKASEFLCTQQVILMHSKDLKTTELAGA